MRRIRTVFEHSQIVIGFEHHRITAQKRRTRRLCNMPHIRSNRNFLVAHLKSVSHRRCRIVRRSKTAHPDIPDFKRSSRIKNQHVIFFDCTYALLHSLPGRTIGIHRRICHARRYTDTAYMVAVLMRHQNRIQVLHRHIQKSKRLPEFFSAQATIN